MNRKGRLALARSCPTETALGDQRRQPPPPGIGYQRDLQDRRKHRSVDAARLATIGQQVRVLLSGDAVGLYTASEVHPEDPDTTVRMGRRGRKRLGTSDEFSCASRLALWTGGSRQPTRPSTPTRRLLPCSSRWSATFDSANEQSLRTYGMPHQITFRFWYLSISSSWRSL